MDGEKFLPLQNAADEASRFWRSWQSDPDAQQKVDGNPHDVITDTLVGRYGLSEAEAAQVEYVALADVMRATGLIQ